MSNQPNLSVLVVAHNEAEQLAEGSWGNLPGGRSSDWSIRKVISWVFSAFILMSIASRLCESIIG